MSEIEFGPPSDEPPAPPPPPLVPSIPWEDPTIPFWSGLFQTVGMFIVDPSEGFRRIAAGTDLGRPVAYYLAFGWLGALVGALYGVFFNRVLRMLLPIGEGGVPRGLPPQIERLFESLQSPQWQIGITLFVAPVLLVIGLFVGSAILHGVLAMIGGTSRGFAATIRVYCYAGTVALVRFLPFCGNYASMIWMVVLLILGLGIVHRCGAGKAAVAVLLPVALFCVCCIAVVGGLLLTGMLGSMAAAR